MSTDEATSLLESKGGGVLSMGTIDRGYGIPISFGYEESQDRIVLEFVNGPESNKRRFAHATDEATLAVYNYEDPDRRESVIVTGTLRRLAPEDVSDRFASIFFSQADDAAGDLRWTDLDEVERELVRAADREHHGASQRRAAPPGRAVATGRYRSGGDGFTSLRRAVDLNHGHSARSVARFAPWFKATRHDPIGCRNRGAINRAARRRIDTRIAGGGFEPPTSGL